MYVSQEGSGQAPVLEDKVDHKTLLYGLAQGPRKHTEQTSLCSGIWRRPLPGPRRPPGGSAKAADRAGGVTGSLGRAGLSLGPEAGGAAAWLRTQVVSQPASFSPPWSPQGPSTHPLAQLRAAPPTIPHPTAHSKEQRGWGFYTAHLPVRGQQAGVLKGVWL